MIVDAIQSPLFALLLLVIGVVTACMAGNGVWSKLLQWGAGLAIVAGLSLIGSRLWFMVV